MFTWPRTDDLLILDSEWLLRRVNPNWIVFDNNLGRCRPSTQCFKGQDLSVYRESLLTNSTDILEEKHPGWGLIKFTTGLARQLKQLVVPDAEIDPMWPGDPCIHAHALVCGKKPGSTCDEFARNSQWIRMPTMRPPECE
jgi:hypothetical protein